MSLAVADIRPGMFAVVNTGSRFTGVIEWMEKISGEGKSLYDHAVICSRIDPARGPMIVEAQPGGAQENPWHYEDRPHVWSAGIVSTPEAAGEAARRYIHVPYSFADYEAIAAHRWDIPVPGLQDFIADTGHMICSQLVDQAEQDKGCHLFTDGRWPGYVEPMDLAHLLHAA